MAENIFQIFANCLATPFAAGRNGGELKGYFTVVLKVEPKDKYGKAFGFAVGGGVPSEHFSYDTKWVRFGEIPGAGCYQWNQVTKPQAEIEALVHRFQSYIKPRYSWPAFGDADVKVSYKKLPDVELENRIYLKVPYSEKDQAKFLGARWDATQKKWYVSEAEMSTTFSRWL